jgi:peptidoglycan/LPS O-acetylase OafA/YrhL
MTLSTKQNRLVNIQALRGVAALLVACMHVLQPASLGHNPIITAACNFMLNVGNFGVDIFFVLSGVIVSMQIDRSEGGLRSTTSFLVRRAARIYPIFWLSLAVMVGIRLQHGQYGDLALLSGNLRQYVLLAPSQSHPVSWTLPFEIHFYAVAAIALLMGKHAKAGLIAWCGLQVLLVVLSYTGLITNYIFFGRSLLSLSPASSSLRCAPQSSGGP